MSETGITLNANVGSSSDGPVAYWFRYGPTPVYGTETTHRSLDAESGSLTPVEEPLTGLSPDSTYHWQVCAQDSDEDPPREVCSSDRTFGTVGDYLRGFATEFVVDQVGQNRFIGSIRFDDVRSGPAGENPAGTFRRFPRFADYTDFAVTCLRMNGGQAVIGGESLPGGGETADVFVFLDLSESGNGTIATEPIGNRSPLECPASPSESAEIHGFDGYEGQDFPEQRFRMHDAP